MSRGQTGQCRVGPCSSPPYVPLPTVGDRSSKHPRKTRRTRAIRSTHRRAPAMTHVQHPCADTELVGTAPAQHSRGEP